MDKIAVAVAAALLLGGCASGGPKTDQTPIAAFKPGVTTVAQAEAALGQPFQVTHLPDGTEQLQYVSKYRAMADNSMPTTGSEIPKHVEKTVSTVLKFDASGHFVSASSNARQQGSNWPSDLGHVDGGDLQRRNGG